MHWHVVGLIFTLGRRAPRAETFLPLFSGIINFWNFFRKCTYFAACSIHFATLLQCCAFFVFLAALNVCCKVGKVFLFFFFFLIYIVVYFKIKIKCCAYIVSAWLSFEIGLLLHRTTTRKYLWEATCKKRKFS